MIKMRLEIVILMLLGGALSYPDKRKDEKRRSIDDGLSRDVEGRQGQDTDTTTAEGEAPEPEMDLDPLTGTCKNLPMPSQQDLSPLKCFHCQSNTKTEIDPKCDNSLWKHLKHSERARLRLTCDRLKGKFCTKIIRKRYKERITERGCFKEYVKGPNGTSIRAQNGCIVFKQAGWIVTVCFCDKNFCNGATKLGNKLISLVLVVWNLLINSLV